MSRIPWQTTWLNMALLFAARSTCTRARTGAVIVTAGNQILTSGYNGAPTGVPHCEDVGCHLINDHCVRANHAEANALMQAAKLGVSVQHAVMYCTHRPCVYCTKLIIQAGIYEVIYIHDYDTDDAKDFVQWVLSPGNLIMRRAD